MSELNSEPTDAPLRDVIESLLARLKVLQVAIQPIQPISIRPIQPIQPIPAANAVAIQQQVVQLQQHFQQLVTMLAAADLSGDQLQRLRPYQTEAHRLLRLMGVVALKLRAAKRIETWDQQRSHLASQLNQLQSFAQAIADELYR
jgi:hypothetical protein